jgi:cell division protein FtsI (penicillin-binding protein 3)
VLLTCCLGAGLIVVGRASQIQLFQRTVWAAEAERQHRETSPLPARRGTILDRNGVPLALSQVWYTVSLAPHELQDPEEAARALVSALGISRRNANRAVRSDRRWVVLAGHYPPAVRDLLRGQKGIHLQPDPIRFYPHKDLAAGFLGTVIDHDGRGGVEQRMDSILRGSPGEEIRARDFRGEPIPGQSWLVKAPRPGGEVQLTVDLDLQEIAYECLEEAVEATEAEGGDILITEPETGELLALVSIRDGSTSALSTIHTPYEPGSTLKPFTVAAILSHGVADLGDSVDTEEGYWRVAGRTITDVHPYGKLTLAEALKVSSNVGISKMAQGLSPEDQYESLRDFGFGVRTGIRLPGESEGILRPPREWSGQSGASLAIGYEVSVTPLQMTLAYGALANGGRLMEPRLIREVRSWSGEILDRPEPRQVRRVVSKRVAQRVNEVLVQVVEEGTGTAARLNSFSVAGKSGTSRIAAPDGGYAQGRYFSSFAGFFPAEDPQLVIFVKLNDPKGAYYGGAAAAPVIRRTMEAVLAARRPPIDRRALAAMRRSASVASRSTPIRFASLSLDEPEPAVTLPPGTSTRGGWVVVPEVAGVSVRTASRRLHQMGLHVRWNGSSPIVGAQPREGARLAPGDTVTLLGREAR